MKIAVHIIAILAAFHLGVSSPSGVSAQEASGPDAPGKSTSSDSGAFPGDETSVKQAMDTRRQIKEAISDLAGRLSLPASEIALAEVRAVTWPDSSLGCPQPGMAYATVMVPGNLIVLVADEESYEYHSGRDGQPIFCADPSPASNSDSVSD